VGLGGRDITPATLHGVVGHLMQHATPGERPVWWEVKA
jgi:hypothetical protein